MRLLARIRAWWRPADPCPRCPRFDALLAAVLARPDWLRDRPRATPTDAPATDPTAPLRACGMQCDKRAYAFEALVKYQLACELADTHAELERLRGPVALSILEAQQLGRRSVH